MEAQILELRAQGKTYNEIKSILGCSKSTISYYCGEGQKEKTKNRGIKNRAKKSNIINKKLQRFTRDKVKNFKKGTRGGLTNSDFSYTDAFTFISKVSICYLSGRPINLEDSRSYHLDHKIPHAKGGKNTLNNLGVACRDANMAKNDMLLDDFIQLCIDVCKHNGYKVE